MKEARYRVIELNNEIPAFSFFNYLFLNHSEKQLSEEEMARIKEHEIVHAKQYHSIDIILIELTSIFLWFNPAVKYLKKAFQEVHEYLADEGLSLNAKMKKSYSLLLLRLTTESSVCDLSSGFSAKQISQRISMLEKPRSLPRQRFIFSLILPAALFLLMSFSYMETRSNSEAHYKQQEVLNTSISDTDIAGKIIWVDNTVYSDKQLNKTLGVKSGDQFNYNELMKDIWQAKKSPSSLYFDKGYVFFNITLDTIRNPTGSIDLTFTIYEGIPAKIGKLIIKGNESVPEEEIKEKIVIKTGDLFSREKIIQSAKAVKTMEKFASVERIPEIVPVPDPSKETADFAVVDLLFDFTRK